MPYRRCSIAALLLASLPVLAQDVLLKPEEIKAQLVGRKLFSRATSNGMLGDFIMSADGTAMLSASNGFNDSGTWRLNETGYCTRWKKLREGNEACFNVMRRGSRTYVLNADGSLSAEILRIVD